MTTQHLRRCDTWCSSRAHRVYHPVEHPVHRPPFGTLPGRKHTSCRAAPESGPNQSASAVQDASSEIATTEGTPASYANQPTAGNATQTQTQTAGKAAVNPLQDSIGQRRRPKAESTDAVATFLTRRFGLAGGFAWLALLAVGSLGEQVKTRWEVAQEEAGTRDVSETKEVVLPSGVRYTDLRTGGGSYPVKGYLMVLDFVLKANGEVVEDTRSRGKPIVFLFGGRPFVGGMCAGSEEAMAGMRAGGKRRVIVPAGLGFGESGAMLRPTEHVPDKRGVIPPRAELEYELELVRVSIPPS